jgi:RHS repeat-associated protein
VYDYGEVGSVVTHVTKKKILAMNGADDGEDQTTTYTFNYNEVRPGDPTSRVKTYLSDVTDPLDVTNPVGHTTHYEVDSEGVTHAVTDAAGVRTEYTYNSKKAVTRIDTKLGGALGPLLSREENTYYNNDTVWLATHTDVRGNYTHYDRDPDNLSLVTAVKVSAPVGGVEPNWNTVDPIKQYEYYRRDDENDITDDATLAPDESHSERLCEVAPDLCETPPSGWTPDKLKDGLVGDGHEDFGQWDYGFCVLGNASYWDWSSTKFISRLDLYCSPVPSPNYSACGEPLYLPDNVSVYARIGTGGYIKVAEIGVSSTIEWADETWHSQSVKAGHIPVNANASSLKIVYRSDYGFTRLGEIRVFERSSLSDGLPGQLKKEIVPKVDGDTDQETTYKYDQNGKCLYWPTQTIYQYPSGSSYTTKTAYTCYDDAGRTVYTSDASGTSMATGRKVWYTYDTLGRAQKTIYAWQTAPTSDDAPASGMASVYTENVYDCCKLLRSRGENGNWTYYDYDDMNRVIGTWTDVQGDDTSSHRLVTYHYDSFGNQDMVTTCSGLDTNNLPIERVTTYTYDALNRVTNIDYPSSLIASEEFGYDVAGRLRYKKGGPESKYTLYRYDDNGRLAAVHDGYSSVPGTFPTTGGNVTYAYQGNSNLRTSMVSGSLSSNYTYDIQGRLESYKPPVGLVSGFKVWYHYNNAGQKTEIKITNGSTTPYDVTYDYFANGWLKEVKNLGTNVASYAYDAVGNRLTQTNHNGTSTEYAYDTSDPRYLLNSITHKHGTTELAKIDYAPTGHDPRDASGNPRSMKDWTGVWDYGYDANNRLTSATPPNPVPEQPAGGPYGYDWVGNRMNPPTGSNHMVYNAADQLLQWPGMHGADATTHAGYTYYPDGSLHYENNAAGTSVIKGYIYTPDRLLDTAEFDGNTKTLINTWDADQNRVGFSVNSTNHTFVYDTTAGIPAVIQEDGVFYIREPGGSLIARKDDSNWSYYHFDQLGSTRLLTAVDVNETDKFGGVTDKYAYDVSGALIAHERLSDSVDQPYQYVGQLGYYSHCREPGLGLLQLGVRFYDTHTGMFTQSDPLQSGLNSYAYAGVNPLCWVDPRGEKYKWNDPHCLRLVRKMRNTTRELFNTLYEMELDLLNLRLTCKGGKERDSIQGHFEKLLRLKDIVDNQLCQYKNDCEEPPTPAPPSPPRPKIGNPPPVDDGDVERGITWAAIAAAIAAAGRALGESAKNCPCPP